MESKVRAFACDLGTRGEKSRSTLLTNVMPRHEVPSFIGLLPLQRLIKLEACVALRAPSRPVEIDEFLREFRTSMTPGQPQQPRQRIGAAPGTIHSDHRSASSASNTPGSPEVGARRAELRDLPSLADARVTYKCSWTSLRPARRAPTPILVRSATCLQRTSCCGHATPECRERPESGSTRRTV
jgi:hypothetical protein